MRFGVLGQTHVIFLHGNRRDSSYHVSKKAWVLYISNIILRLTSMKNMRIISHSNFEHSKSSELRWAWRWRHFGTPELEPRVAAALAQNICTNYVVHDSDKNHHNVAHKMLVSTGSGWAVYAVPQHRTSCPIWIYAKIWTPTSLKYTYTISLWHTEWLMELAIRLLFVWEMKKLTAWTI